MNDQAADRRAQALAEVNKMQTDLTACQAEISTLRRELDRAQDRLDMVVEERDRYRHESKVYRDKLVELSAAMSNIGLMTISAQEIMMTVRELTSETPEQAAAEQESARAAVAALPGRVSEETSGQ